MLLYWYTGTGTSTGTCGFVSFTLTFAGWLRRAVLIYYICRTRMLILVNKLLHDFVLVWILGALIKPPLFNS